MQLASKCTKALSVWAMALALASGALLSATDSSAAETTPQEGAPYFEQKADLDRDGNMETVSLVAYNTKQEEGYFGQLVVKDSSGAVIWQGDKPTEAGSREAFGLWMFGEAGIELIGDIDGDGKIELVGPMAQSDVRPTAFRVWRWTGRSFKQLFIKSLVEKPKRSGHYLWTAPNQPYGQDRWVQKFTGNNASPLKAAIFCFTPPDKCVILPAVLAPLKNGLSIVRWTHKPEKS